MEKSQEVRKRLTARDAAGNAHYPYCFREDTCSGCGGGGKCDGCTFDNEICDRLAEYEDQEYVAETLLQYFKRMFPKAEVDASGIPPLICPHNIGYEKDFEACSNGDCVKCWNQPKDKDM